ncbi:hypothetical protein L195_g013857 [Trifolium pratense]|uniref:Retrotransposon Copia-like N-terminal domain-containing protein n=1 Tax=Trifolium pratense TaxID=57577 RepID=A0A2K3PPA9_TRIPR|nr:hypothetical protein L195_g013857 [Trifolium pratense]
MPRAAPVVPQTNTASILYIHPSEGPNSISIIPKLNGLNYLAWSRSMKHALGAKNKLPFVDGSMEIPDFDDLNRNQWERGNYLVYSWILNSVSDPIASTITFHDNAIDVWHDLAERFSKADRVRIATLRSSINNLNSQTRCILVVQEENNHPPIAMVEESTSLINAAQKFFNRGKGTTSGGGKNNKYCTFCHPNNHVVEFCYAKHGHPNQGRNAASVNASTNEDGESSNAQASSSASSSNTNQISALTHGPSTNEPPSGIVSTLTCSLHTDSVGI